MTQRQSTFEESASRDLARGGFNGCSDSFPVETRRRASFVRRSCPNSVPHFWSRLIGSKPPLDTISVDAIDVRFDALSYNGRGNKRNCDSPDTSARARERERVRLMALLFPLSFFVRLESLLAVSARRRRIDWTRYG